MEIGAESVFQLSVSTPPALRQSPEGASKAGKLHGLAVTTATRTEALPDTPTVGEFVPGYESSGWYGIGAPKNTPSEIVDCRVRSGRRFGIHSAPP
jgi:hypothetical protein